MLPMCQHLCMKTLCAVHMQAVMAPMGDLCMTLGCQAHTYISADRPNFENGSLWSQFAFLLIIAASRNTPHLP